MSTKHNVVPMITVVFTLLGAGARTASARQPIDPEPTFRMSGPRVRVIPREESPKRRYGRNWRAKQRCERLNLVPLTEVNGMTVANSERAWGTQLTVDRLKGLAEQYSEQFPGAPPIGIHDVSKRCGGPLEPHVSHQFGRDVDISVPNKRRSGFVEATPRTLHVERTWFLILALLRTCDVDFIFLDQKLQRELYKAGVRMGLSRQELGLVLQFPHRGAAGVVRHWDGHKNHLHVRFRKAASDPKLLSACALCSNPDDHNRPSLVERMFQTMTGVAMRGNEYHYENTKDPKSMFTSAAY